MPRPRNPATERWHVDRAVSWRKVYGNCSSLEDVVKTDAAIHRWCAAVKNYAEPKPVDAEWFRCEVDKIRLVRVQLVKEIIDLVRSGTPYHKIMRMVSEQVVLETLVVTHGNQNEAARMLGINRATIRKYSGLLPVKREKSF